MAKLRKTLGGIDWPVCEALMRQIETQSTVTLSRWAVDHAAREYLPLCGGNPGPDGGCGGLPEASDRTALP